MIKTVDTQCAECGAPDAPVLIIEGNVEAQHCALCAMARIGNDEMRPATLLLSNRPVPGNAPDLDDGAPVTG